MENKLPEGWEWKKLGDFIELKYGKGLKKENRNLSGKFPVYGSNGVVDYHDDAIVSEPCLIVGRKGSIGAVHLSKNPCWPIDTTYYVLPPKEVDLTFLFYLLSTLNLENLNKSTAIPGLNRNDVYSKLVPLPPLETQKKIVSILEKTEETKKLRAQADELTQQLLQSVFLEMFGDPVKNPKNWDVEKVQDVISSIEAGWSANGEQRPREENEYAVLKVSAVTQGIFLPEECKVINKDIEFKKVVTPEKGDVLFSRANTLELVGASCLIREDHPYLLLPDKLWKINVNKEKICPEYFKFVLSYPTIRSEISKRSTGTSGSMYNISMNKLKLIEITVPPIEIQKKFSIIVETIENTKDFEKQSSLEINTLFDALMQKAFTGELVA